MPNIKILDLLKVSIAKYFYSFDNYGLPEHFDDYFRKIASLRNYHTRLTSLRNTIIGNENISGQLSSVHIGPKL